MVFMEFLTITDWWFGTMEFYDFPLGIISPTDELSRVGIPPTR
jgi:hypothetical protein